MYTVDNLTIQKYIFSAAKQTNHYEEHLLVNIYYSQL